jgi:hypothetical protein
VLPKAAADRQKKANRAVPWVFQQRRPLASFLSPNRRPAAFSMSRFSCTLALSADAHEFVLALK